MRNHFSDPTANTAIANIERERRRAEWLKKRKSTPSVRPGSGSGWHSPQGSENAWEKKPRT